MNIAFDMQFTKTMSNQRGIGRYSRSLIKALKTVDQENTYFEYYPALNDPHLERQLKNFLDKNNIQIFHFTSPFEAGIFKLMNRKWFGRTKLVVTLYDVIPLIFYGAYLRTESEIKWYNKVLDFIRSCDAILAISETTRKDAVAYAKMDPGKIKVILGGVDPKFRKLPKSKPSPRFGITKPYVIYTGGDDFRKNLQVTVYAFGKANSLLASQYQLVIVGDIYHKEKLYQLANRANLAQEDLIITGYVSDEDLVRLYNGAELFVNLSLYEGLGLPVLEAMACGVPVLTAHTSSLHEITGEAAYKVNPGSIPEIIYGLTELLSHPALRAHYGKKGLEHCRKFNWNDVAQRVIKEYKNLYSLS